MQLFRITLLLLSLVPAIAHAEYETRLRDAGPATGIRLAGTDEPGGTSKVYIVQLRTPSAVEAHAARAPRVMSKIAASRAPAAFDRHNASVQQHVARITAEQEDLISSVGPGIRRIYSYRYSLNGFAAHMTPAQAHKLENNDAVLRVWEDEVRPLATHFSPEFLGLFQPVVGLRGAPGLDGDGIVIGVIDSGITPQHPALKDTREANRPRLCRTSFAESLLGMFLCRRFKKLDDQLVFAPPENWNGNCQTGDRFAVGDCNNKLIGARWFVDGAQTGGPIHTDEIFSARDADGHGTHTATTAAGNRVKASIFGTFIGNVQGIAPKARIASYKACWMRPGSLTANCNTSDLANAIDAAVADGVHIINYSVGSSLLTVTAPDDIALMNAAKAGVLTVVAAGNDGPNFGTIGSPAGAPWVITTGASSRDGEHSLEAMQVKSPPSVAGKYAVREAAFTPALIDRDPIEGTLVLADDNDETLSDGTAGTRYDACEALVNGTQMSGNIAFIQRGGCEFEIKIANAEDAGAIAVVVYNIAGDPIVMTGTPGLSDIPALMVGQADGNMLFDEIDTGQTVEVVLDKGFFLTEADTGNNIGVFSSRGPGPLGDVLKPDVTAPGINILAGTSPNDVNSIPGELFAFLSGTSMAAPHVAGVAALLKQSHPDWTPAALKSALMTTAYQNVTLSDGTTQAIGFDFGSGHIDPNRANDPGLVYDITADEYDAIACGTASPAVDQARCDDLAASGFSFEPADMNQPSISVGRLANTRTVSRRVTNVSDQSETYAAVIDPPAGIDVRVSPAMLTVAPGGSATFDVTYTYQSGPMDLWRFGSLTWTGSDHNVRSVLAVRPTSVNAPAEVVSFGGSGSITFPVEFGYTGSYSPGVHGLRLPLVIDAFVDEDPNRTFTFRTGNGVNAHLVDVPADQAFLRFALFDELTDGDDDLDMYLFYCPDNINCTKVAESGEPTSREQIDVLLPGAGRYAVFIHGFDTDDVAGGPGANYTLLGWSFGLFEDLGNMTATGPSFVTAGATEDIKVNWSGLASNTIYLGGISHNTPQGLVAITLITIQN